MHDYELAEVFQRQSGIITYQQALDGGLTRAQIRHRERSGAWIRVHRGIYRNALFPISWRSGLWLGTLATGGAVSHHSAARLHRLDPIGRDRGPEVVVKHGRFVPVDGVTVHQSTQIDRIDQIVVDDLTCTGRARTVLDLGATMRPGRLGKVVDAQLRKKLITLAELWDVLVRHSVQGRDGCGSLRLVAEERLGQERIALSDWSYWVANLLESAGLPSPRLEFRAHREDGTFLAQVDLAYPEALLAIELDSYEFHSDLESFGRDRSRLRHLVVEGWTVLPFTWKDYTQRPDQLITQIRTILMRVMVTE